jgi:hypothetical protein
VVALIIATSRSGAATIHVCWKRARKHRMKTTQFIAGCFGILGFMVSILAGLHADNGFDTIIVRAIGAAAGCYLLGYVIGVMAGSVAQEHAQRLAARVAETEAVERAKEAQEAAAAPPKAPHAIPVATQA